MPSGTIPPPPRSLLVGLAIMAVLCLSGGFLFDRETRLTPWLKLERKSSSSLGMVELFFTTEEGALDSLKEYQAQGYHASIANPVETMVQIQSGFVVTDFLSPEAAQSAAETLSRVYNFPVTTKRENNDRISVQVGPVFENEEAANDLVNRLQKLGFRWSVKPHYVERPGTYYKIILNDIPMDKANEIQKNFENRGMKANIVQTP